MKSTKRNGIRTAKYLAVFALSLSLVAIVTHITVCGQTRLTNNVRTVPPVVIPTGAVVMEWNQYAAALTLLPSSALAPVQQTRVMAIVQVSGHDAVNGITKEYETYLAPGPGPQDASPEAAAIAAYYQALTTLFGNGPFTVLGNKTLSQLYSESLAAHGLSEADPGIGYGNAAAAAVLAIRSNDGAAFAQFAYDGPDTNAGTWRLLPGQTALLPGWGRVLPFVLRSGSQFRADPPPALDSDVYTRDYNEIKEIGRAGSTTRTQLQSNIATFWRASPTAIWNPVMRQSLAARSFNLSETARAFALFYLAASDSGVACWETKYIYDFWRPQSAIRAGNSDGNPDTVGDTTWAPFIPTPPHPDYTSGHTANSSAMATVLESLFGDGLDSPISVTLSGITRQWNTYGQAVDEVIDARVYSGIHFRNSDIAGARQGRQVAQFVLVHALRQCRGRGSRCS